MARTPWSSPPPGQTVDRVAMIVQAGDDLFAVETSSDAGDIEVRLRYDQDEDDYDYDYDLRIHEPRRLFTFVPSELQMNVLARFRCSAPYLYRMWTLKAWPELAADTRCDATHEPAPGVRLRCQRWRGHESDAEARLHVAGSAAWRDGEPPALA